MHLLISTGTGRALFYAFDLTPLPPEQAYELWWHRANSTVAAAASEPGGEPPHAGGPRGCQGDHLESRVACLGTKDPLLLYHAGIIAAAAGNIELAERWLDDALRRPALLGPRRTAHAATTRDPARMGDAIALRVLDTQLTESRRD